MSSKAASASREPCSHQRATDRWPTGTHLWAERYDREFTDIFVLQDEITRSVAAAIEPRMLAAEGVRSLSRSPDDLDAWALVARA